MDECRPKYDDHMGHEFHSLSRLNHSEANKTPGTMVAGCPPLYHPNELRSVKMYNYALIWYTIFPSSVQRSRGLQYYFTALMEKYLRRWFSLQLKSDENFASLKCHPWPRYHHLLCLYHDSKQPGNVHNLGAIGLAGCGWKQCEICIDFELQWKSLVKWNNCQQSKYRSSSMTQNNRDPTLLHFANLRQRYHT